MSFIGNKPDSFGYSSTSYDHFSGTGSQTVYTLTRSVSANADIFVTVNNVPQDPGVAYYVTNLNTLTFTSAPSAVANNIVVVYRNFVQTGLALGANTVTSFTIAPGAVQAYQISSVSNTSISGQITSTQIDVASANGTGAIKVPVGNTATRPAAAVGYIRYNTDLNTLESANATAWANVGSSSASSGNATRFKNRIINGDMRIDQRNAGASVTITNTSAATYTLDRWAAYGSVASKFSVQQNAASVTPPVGFVNYLGSTSASAYSVGSSEEFTINQNIEGLNMTDLGWGTVNAKTVTLSFWVLSSLTGTFGGSIRNNAANRSYPFSYTISSANTWEQKSITIAGDTTGTWLTTNGVGIRLGFSLGSGTTISGTANTWAAANYTSATGATSVVGTNGATFYITGVQLEVGSQATSFEYVDYGTQLVLCQRYYEIGSFTQRAAASNGNYCGQFFPFSVTKRTGPSMAASGTSYPYNCSGLALAGGYTSGFEMYILASGPYAVSSSWSASAEL